MQPSTTLCLRRLCICSQACRLTAGSHAGWAAVQDALKLHEAVSEHEVDKVSLEAQLKQAQDQLQEQGNALNSHLHTAQEVLFP